MCLLEFTARVLLFQRWSARFADKVRAGVRGVAVERLHGYRRCAAKTGSAEGLLGIHGTEPAHGRLEAVGPGLECIRTLPSTAGAGRFFQLLGPVLAKSFTSNCLSCKCSSESLAT